MKKLFILICVVSVSTNMAFAAMGAFDAGAINREYMQDMRRHEFQTREKDRASLIQKEHETEKKSLNIPDSTVLKNISFVGNQAVSSETLFRIVESNIGEKVNEQTVSNMRKMILKYYNSNGYFSAIVFADITKISDGELIFQIKENGINSITIE